jgi:MFS family permease
MPALIAFRALQGLGAGAVQPMSITIVGDIYTLAERARVQGYIASVWGLASVVGPTLGGLFSEYLAWQWIFYVNVPLGLIAATLLIRRFHETVERRSHRIDWLGGGLLTAGLSLVILATLEGGNAWAWGAPQSLGAYGLGLVLLLAFAAVERRAAEPVLPTWVLSRRLLATTAGVAVGVGMLLMGVTTYVPTFLEAMVGATPLVSGLTLAALTLGWPLSASQVGRVYLRLGFRRTVMIGSSTVITASVTLALVSASPSVVLTGVACFGLGLGLGFVAAPALIAAQSSVDWGERGVVTGTNMFARSIGSAVGVAGLGALVNNVMRGATATADPALFGVAVSRAFWAIACVAVVTAGVGLLMPKDRPHEVDARVGGADLYADPDHATGQEGLP